MYLFSIAASTLDEQGLACTLFKANWAFSNEYKPSVSHHHHAVCSRCVHAAGLGNASLSLIPLYWCLEITEESTLMTSTPFRADWISKSFAGIVLGFYAAMAICGLFFLLPLQIGRSGEAQLIMWLLGPIWLTILSTCFLFRSGARAWFWLGLTNVVLYALYFLFKSF
jgi:hypothetical protein